MKLGMIKFGTVLLIIILLCVAGSVECGLRNEKAKNKTICTSCQKKEQHTEKPLGDDGSARQEKSDK